MTAYTKKDRELREAVRRPKPKCDWYGLSNTFHARKPEQRTCGCGRTLIDRGVGRVPSQCDWCRAEVSRERSRKKK